MGTTILQATVGAGKTEAALERLSQTIRDPQRPFARAWVLLATGRQEVAFRQRLIELQDERSVYFNAEFFNFYELNRRLLNLAGKLPRRIDEPARLGLLRNILQKLQRDGDLTLFAPIAHTVGLLRVMADFIMELKQNRVRPEDFEAAATSKKDRELALIYRQVQEALIQYELVDLEGEGWLALSAVQDADNLTLAHNVDLLLVDGYDQFTRVQAELIAALSQRVGETVVTLTRAPGDDDDDPQASIGKRFRQARRRLIEAHEAIGVPITVVDQPAPQIHKQADLLLLARNIFSDEPKEPTTGGVHFIEAPEPVQEVAAVLRSVKARLLAGDRADEILIALRDWGRYAPYFQLYEREYQLPLLLHYGEPLAQNPALYTLIRALKLPGRDPDAVTSFRRRELFDVLRSPYLIVPGFADETIELLERVSFAQQVIGGRSAWLDALERASEPFYDEDADTYDDPLLTPQQYSDLAAALEDFFDGVTFPRQDTLSNYVEMLEERIGEDPLKNPEDDPDEPRIHQPYSLNIPRAVRDVADAGDLERIIARDTVALNMLKDLLRGMLATEQFIEQAFGDVQSGMVRWEDVLADMIAGVESTAPTQRNPIRSGRVLVTTAAEARGLPHDHVYVLGLSEEIFPAVVPEDPIYLDNERRRLRERGIRIETQAERADDDGIFYELICLARQSLTLSRPYIRQGKPWVESHLWRMSQAVFENPTVDRLRVGAVVAAEEVSSLDETLLVLADGLSNETVSPSVQDLYGWVVQTDHAHERWSRVLQGRRSEIRRMSNQPFDDYSGVLQHPDLIEIVRDELDEDRLWSATQLNDYGICPYRFFAVRLLRLRSVEEPEEGLDALQMGTVNHAILEQTYREMKELRLDITPENGAEVLDIFGEVAERLLRDAPRLYGFRPSALWREEQVVIRRRLQALVEHDFSPDFILNKTGERRVPFHLEQRFGMGKAPGVSVDLGDGEMIRVRGTIDRIDRVGDRLYVIDYKTGSTMLKTDDMAAGRNYQMVVYLLAAEQLRSHYKWPSEVAGGFFWHIRNRETSGSIELGGEQARQHPVVHEALQQLRGQLRAARDGNFAVQPSKIENGQCAAYCEYVKLCRLAVTLQRKQER